MVSIKGLFARNTNKKEQVVMSKIKMDYGVTPHNIGITNLNMLLNVLEISTKVELDNLTMLLSSYLALEETPDTNPNDYKDLLKTYMRNLPELKVAFQKQRLDINALIMHSNRIAIRNMVKNILSKFYSIELVDDNDEILLYKIRQVLGVQ